MADTGQQNSLFALSPVEKLSVITTAVLALVAIAVAWITLGAGAVTGNARTTASGP